LAKHRYPPLVATRHVRSLLHNPGTGVNVLIAAAEDL